MERGLHGPWRSRVRFPPRAQTRSSSAVEHQECLRNLVTAFAAFHGGRRASYARARGFDSLRSNECSGVVQRRGPAAFRSRKQTSGCGSTWQSARLGPERLRVQISPPRPTRGSSSGDGTCPTNRPRRVRSSRPVPCANVAQLAEAADSNLQGGGSNPSVRTDVPLA
jgi:hypothetical protein